ncbi:MAG TPA: ATP-binding protein [Thermoanaerobaculia bacterium]|nr:ATP-binding protein [Thermoanaerobaculia bacterium]
MSDGLRRGPRRAFLLAALAIFLVLLLLGARLGAGRSSEPAGSPLSEWMENGLLVLLLAVAGAAGFVGVRLEGSRDAALRQLELESARYRELCESSGDMIQSVDSRGRLLYVNPSWLETLGYAEGEVLGRPFGDFLLPSELPHCQEVFGRLLAGQEVQDIETIFVAKDGRKIFIEGDSSASFRDGRFVATRGFFRDVTARKLLEADKQRYLRRIETQNLELELRNREVEQANRLKSEFLAAMSHELRTPLTSIIGFSDILEEDQETPLLPIQRTYLGYVRKGARHLLALINEILDLSKIEAGRLDLHPVETPLDGVIPEVVTTLQPLAEAKAIRIECKVAPGLAVYADRVRLKQVLFNLLGNALKFSPEGGAVGLEAACLGSLTCFAVTDSGPGIPPEEQEEIFTEFHQILETSTGVREGTGLGLAIARRLVEQQGGRIWVESEPGRGSCFRFLLPATPQGPGVPLPRERNEAMAPEPRRGTVLVIDGPGEEGVLSDTVLSLGCRPLAARDGREALYLLERIRPSAVVVNLLLPELDGFQLVLRIRADPTLRDLPVLALVKPGMSLPSMDLLCAGPTEVLCPEPGRLRETLEPELAKILGHPLASALAGAGVL